MVTTGETVDRQGGQIDRHGDHVVNNGDAAEVAVLREKVRALEERLAFERSHYAEQLKFERERYAELLHSLRGTLLPGPPSVPWWKKALRRS